jgi:hypothetical protein
MITVFAMEPRRTVSPVVRSDWRPSREGKGEDLEASGIPAVESRLVLYLATPTAEGMPSVIAKLSVQIQASSEEFGWTRSDETGEQVSGCVAEA